MNLNTLILAKLRYQKSPQAIPGPIWGIDSAYNKSEVFRYSNILNTWKCRKISWDVTGHFYYDLG